MIRLETASRYYLCCVQQDLFGHWIVWRAWGAKSSALGNCMRLVAENEAQAQELLDAVLKERAMRGYVPVPSTCTYWT
jgi:hypothetical protein